MKFEIGDMFSVFDEADLFCITTNSFLKNNGALVMGRGIAQQVRDRWPGVDQKVGQQIANYCGHLGTYGLIVSPDWPQAKLGLYQVKLNFRDQAALDLIDLAAQELSKWCLEHPEAKVHLNFPGVGNGQLTIAQVWPVITKHLNKPLRELSSDAVTVWVRESREWEEIGEMMVSDPDYFDDEDAHAGFTAVITDYGWPAPP